MTKLLVIADPTLPVPPTGYGGTERVLFEMINGLAQRGYDITLLGHSASRIPGKLIPYPDPRPRNKLVRGWLKWSFHSLLRSLLPQYDVLHAVCRLDYLLPALKHNIPKHYLFHNPITVDQIEILKHARGKLVLSACGKQMTLPYQSIANWRPIYNAVALERFTFQSIPRSPPYLAVLGRLTANKGIKQAIEIARCAGLPLHLAGNISNEPEDRKYFEQEIKPHIDGHSVIYLGEMNDEQKNIHLGQALAFLNPIQWDEPFGMVTIEAMACGTPVIACPRGELPYIIEDGVTGFLATSIPDFVDAVQRVSKLERVRCRQAIENRFSTSTMVQKYDELLQWLVSSETAIPQHWNLP